MTILIIEDNADIRDNLSELLELEGYQVLTAEHGRAGLKMARERLPHLILCDVLMPYLNGYEVFDGIKSNALTKDIPFVLISSSVERKDIQYAIGKGISAYIGKPFADHELFETIRKCLAQKQS